MKLAKVIEKNGKYFCADCKEELYKDTLKYCQNQDQTYYLDIDKYGDLEYLADGSFPGDTGEFFCGECGISLYNCTEEMAKKILNKKEIDNKGNIK